MRLLVAVLAVLVGGALAQHAYYPQAPLLPIAPKYYPPGSRVVTQGRVTTGPVGRPRPISGSHFGSGNPCSPSPCGPNTRCNVARSGIAQCRCMDGYVPDGNTIEGCKFQCVSDDECSDEQRCQANKCARVCVKGACGINADCRARNHRAICSCPDGYQGRAESSGCFKEQHDERVGPPSFEVDPCLYDPCGTNADCRSKREGEILRAVCTCPRGFYGDPISNCRRGECIENRDCPGHQVCKQLNCINPCTENVCGHNAECKVRNHVPICSCSTGYVGDPLISCRRFDISELCNPSPCGPNTNCRVDRVQERPVCSCIENYIGDPLRECRPECTSDFDCGPKQACENNRCVNPCYNACGENSFCDVRQNRAVCSCPQDYQGDPYSRCYAECTQHDDCDNNKACIKYKCSNPCVGACGSGADCKVERHKPICSCPRGSTGHPFESCRPFTEADLCSSNPCGTNAECTPGKDRSGNDRPVCTCPITYIGNPLVSCAKGECETNNDCLQGKACHLYQCTNPCFHNGKSVCGEDAACKVTNHQPVCYCPGGYTGDPRTECTIDSRIRSSVIRGGSGGFIAGRSKY